MCSCVMLNQGFGLYPEGIGITEGFTEWSCVIRYHFKGHFGSCVQDALEGFPDWKQKNYYFSAGIIIIFQMEDNLHIDTQTQNQQGLRKIRVVVEEIPNCGSAIKLFCFS